MGAQVLWIRGDAQGGPREPIGVLELRCDGASRAALAERDEVDGRCHIRLARAAFGSKDALETRWWSLVMTRARRVSVVRNGSCGDAVTREDVPRIAAALEALDLHDPETMIAVDGGRPVFPWHPRTELR